MRGGGSGDGIIGSRLLSVSFKSVSSTHWLSHVLLLSLLAGGVLSLSGDMYLYVHDIVWISTYLGVGYKAIRWGSPEIYSIYGTVNSGEVLSY